MIILMEVHTAEDESVTFEVSPYAIHALANEYDRRNGEKVTMKVKTEAEFAAHQERLKADMIFQGDDLPC